MGTATRSLLCFSVLVSFLLAIAAALPWYEFVETGYKPTGTSVDGVTSFGDGYVLIGLALTYAAFAARAVWTNHLSGLSLLLMVGTAILAVAIAIADLTPGNLCGSFAWTGGDVTCVAGSGDMFFSSGPGRVTEALWIMIGSGLFLLLAALASPALEHWIYEDDDVVDEFGETWA